ncbi:MAG: LysR family transcriptional regulator [Pseudomonadota bacterium]
MNAPLNHPLPLLEIDVLRAFVAIAETGSFSAAANVVFRTPSAISMQIKKLEETLGRPVFERDTRSVSLTHDGEVLLGYARRLLSINREAMTHFHNSEISGTITIGMNDDIAEQVLKLFLSQFSQSHPNITVNFVMDHSSKLHDRFAQEEMELVLFSCEGHSRKPGIEILLEENLAWGGKRGGSAFEKRPLPISLWEEGCAWRTAALNALGEAGIENRLAFKSSHTAAQLAAIRADLAICPLPESMLKGDVIALTKEHGLPPIGTYAIGMSIKDNADEATLAAADHIRCIYQKMQV